MSLIGFAWPQSESLTAKPPAVESSTDLEVLIQEKNAAIEQKDYKRAFELKKRIDMLQGAQGEQVGQKPDNTEYIKSLETQINKALADEYFDKAALLNKKLEELKQK